MVLEGGIVSSLSEQLAEARDLREAEVVVRTAVAALGIRSCDIVLPCEGEPERPTGLALQVVGPRGVVATLVTRGCSANHPPPATATTITAASQTHRRRLRPRTGARSRSILSLERSGAFWFIGGVRGRKRIAHFTAAASFHR